MKKKVIIGAIVGAVILVILITTIFIFKNKKPEYRLLKVYDVAGNASVTRKDLGELEPYNNMVLESGDRVSLDTGEMVLQADNDKYIYLEEHTELVLKASGSSQNSKTTIELEKGGITNDIQNKLSEDSSYEINTPNSTMSVRGTIYRVYVYEEDGVKYTKITVFQGKVVTHLKYKDGTISTKSVEVEGGKETLIYEDGKTTDYVFDTQDIEYEEVPNYILEILLGMAKDDRELSISQEELEELLSKGPFTVTFVYNGNVFGTQTVERGKKAVVPKLKPAEKGTWQFNFMTPITEDITIEWK